MILGKIVLPHCIFTCIIMLCNDNMFIDMRHKYPFISVLLFVCDAVLDCNQRLGPGFGQTFGLMRKSSNIYKSSLFLALEIS